MQDMERLVFRHALPGFPLAIVLFLSEKLDNGTSAAFLDVAFMLIIAVVLGNLIEQAWMLFFETPTFGLAYNASNRKVLNALASKLPRGRKLSPDDLYYKWDAFIYSNKVPVEVREKAKTLWNFYHINAANSLGAIIGANVGFYISFRNYEAHKWLILLSVFWVLVGILLASKADQTKNLVDGLEENVLITWYSPRAKQKRSRKA